MQKINAIITDDETGAREVIKSLLQHYFPQINIVAECANLPECIKAITKYNPDVVFLDIELPGYNGLEIFDFLNEENSNFELIFTTAYNEYATEAFRLAAIDYLLKPIQFNHLKEAIDRLLAETKKKTALKQLEMLQEGLKGSSIKQICVSTTEGKHYIPFNELLYLEADGSYTTFYLENGRKIHASRRLKYFEDILLKDNYFLRIHRSYLANKSHIGLIKKGESPMIVLKNGASLPASIERLKEIENALNSTS